MWPWAHPFTADPECFSFQAVNPISTMLHGQWSVCEVCTHATVATYGLVLSRLFSHVFCSVGNLHLRVLQFRAVPALGGW